MEEQLKPDEKPQYKLQYFAFGETDIKREKYEDSEIYSLRNKFEKEPDLLLYIVYYYAPMDCGSNGLYHHNFRAHSEKHAQELFDAWKVELGADYQMQIKNIVQVEKAIFKM
jgi:hypothetical protein